MVGHESNSDSGRNSRTMTHYASAMLAGGVAAWVVALVAVALAINAQTNPVNVESPPVSVQPTLAIFTHTPIPSPTLTKTPTPAPTESPARSPAETPAGESFLPVPPTATPGDAEPQPESTALIQPGAGTPVAEAETASEASCNPPDNWERYVVQPDDTLFAFSLGAGGEVTVDELMAANCLDSRYLFVDQIIFLPPGAAENAPPSVPYVSAGELGVSGPRTPNCPCTIRISAGWRREQIAEAINASQTQFTGGDFLAATGPDATAPFDFVSQRPPGTSMEGFLFPGTYTAQNDTTAEQFRDMLLSAFAANVTPQMRADAAAQGVSFYQALIIASIVQREVHGPETQKIVASVYYNRYRAGNRLATTVSVQYALGGSGNWWPRVTASGLKVESPYNTYTRAGLPPTPINSPGLGAIVAAIYPAQTEYRYHTMSCDGSGEAFAATYEEHLRNVNCE